MTLEAEGFRQPGVRPHPRRESGWEFLARGLAAVLLVGLLSAFFWIPFRFVWPVGPAVAMALLTVLVASLASRLHRLRQRLDELERRLETPPAGPEPPQK